MEFQKLTKKDNIEYFPDVVLRDIGSYLEYGPFTLDLPEYTVDVKFKCKWFGPVLIKEGHTPDSFPEYIRQFRNTIKPDHEHKVQTLQQYLKPEYVIS